MCPSAEAGRVVTVKVIGYQSICEGFGHQEINGVHGGGASEGPI